ncbi:MAG: hypothetical protein ACRDDX_12590 [Cellulosilyticaceae bacterium]
MFREKYDINPKHLAIWASIYLLTIIPAYEILFARVPLLFGAIVIIENIVCIYIFEETFLDELLESIKESKVFLFFTISLLMALLMFVNLLFHNVQLFGVLCVIELAGFFLTRGIKNLKELMKK